MNAAETVTIYAGIGARDAHDQVVALAERLKAPVVHTSRAKEFIEPDNPYNVGMTGILGNEAGDGGHRPCRYDAVPRHRFRLDAILSRQAR